MDPAGERLTGVVDPPSDPPTVDWGAAPNKYHDLVALAEERAEALADVWSDGEEKPAELDTPDARLVCWASTDNGEYLYWVVRPDADPDEWTVLISEGRGPGWEHHPTGCAGSCSTG